MRLRWNDVGAVLVALVLVGCGLPASELGAPIVVPTLPDTLPPAGNGIELPSPEPAASEVVDPQDWPSDSGRAEGVADEVAGYTGDRWAQHADGVVSVLADTLAIRDGVVRGLVRNGRDEPVGPVQIVIGDTSTTIPLPVLRPGEPAPFSLPVGPDVAVADLAFDVDAPTTPRSPGRAVRLATFWRRGVGDPRPVDTYLYADVVGEPTAAVAFGEVRAAEQVDGLVVVAAWIDSDGRVLAVDESADLQLPTLPPGGATDFVVAGHGPPALDAARLVLWGSGS